MNQTLQSSNTNTNTTISQLPEEADPNLISNQTSLELFSHLINKSYITKPGLWFNILWNLIINNIIVVACVLTYILMLSNQTSRSIIVIIYIFFSIFWSIFPYYLRCIMLYKITGISSCRHRLIYSLIGLLCWCIALFIYN